MSPGYPDQYPGGLECLYIIQAQSGRIITLEVDDLDLDDSRDYILVRDGDSPKSQPIARLTGDLESNQRIIISTKSQLYLYFKTSLGDSKRGFRIRYTQGCKATIVARNGTLMSPAFGLSNYPSNQDCLYKIRNPGRGALSLNFESFDVDKSDFVQVYDGSSTSGLRLHPANGFTADSKPKITLTASSGEMLVRFTTDALHNNQGWSATFSAGNYLTKQNKLVINDINFSFRLSNITTWNWSASFQQRYNIWNNNHLQLPSRTRICNGTK